MVEAASMSETSVNFYQTTRRDIPEDRLLHTHRENLKSHLKFCMSIDLSAAFAWVFLFCVKQQHGGSAKPSFNFCFDGDNKPLELDV
jgi:hypothetical protein